MSRTQEKIGVPPPLSPRERALIETPPCGRVRFEMVLRPHRSLARADFRRLMGIFAAISLLAAARMWWVGAWPAAAFFVLDAGLLWLALKYSYRTGRTLEHLRLTDRRLEIVRLRPPDRVRRWAFEPWWTRVEIEERPGTAPHLVLRQRDRRLVLGGFLLPDERHEVAAELRRALGELRVA
ncbi:MAG: DUF2244 domain-containing protein [Alphaproteobacteria bacterium]|nr:MAG: DUF2244 domain-containing protein [Alphaproteobacteria bacterium]